MDVHAGSSLVQSEEPMVTSPPTALVGPVTLEVSDPDAGNPLPAVGAEVSLSVVLGVSSDPPLGLKSALHIASANTPPSDSAPMPPALGFPLFLSNLQNVLNSVSAQLRSCGAPVPDQVLSLLQWNPLLLQRQIDDLKASNIVLTQWCSDAEEIYT